MISPVRLVHVTTVPESLGFLRGQIDYVRARGFDPAAISSPGPLLEEFAVREKIDVRAIEMPRRLSPLADLAALVRLVQELRRLRPAIVHAHTPKGGLLGVLAAALAGVPIRIYHMRGLPLVTAKGPKRLLLRWTERIACAAAHRVFCVSKSVRARAIEERLAPAEKLVVLAEGSGQGVDATGRFDPDRTRSDLRERLGIPDDSTVVAFVGRLAREKGVGELVEAFVGLSDRDARLHLIVAGDLDVRDPIPEPVIRTIQEHPRIHSLGYEPDSPAVYAAADFVALPTYREGFPNVVLEAAAMRKPVVATSVDGCIDAVEPDVTGLLVPPRDVVALSAAMTRYAGERDLAKTHGLAARARVLRSFQQEAIWAATHEQYRELLDGASGRAYDRAKRVFDAVVAGASLALLSAPMLAIGVAVAANMGRPVIFSQLRPGKDERLFRLFKFRTMTDARGHDGQLLPDSERLTAFGAFLRRTSLDELPELWNVLRGDMSLVGPRPLLVKYLPFYRGAEKLRHSVRPGITGYAQIHGRNEVGWDDRLALDVWYVRNRTFRLDLEILLSTVFVVLRREGVVVDSRSALLDLDQERVASTR